MMKIKISKVDSEGPMEDMAEDGEEAGEYDEHELECDARLLLDAEKIKADPKKMAALKPVLAKLAKAVDGIKSLADLKDLAKKKAKET